MSENDERDPHTAGDAGDPLDAFEAFRARRREEQQENEPFPEAYLAATTAGPFEEPAAEPYASAPYPDEPFPPRPFVAPAEYAAEPPPIGAGVGFDFSGEEPPPSPVASNPRRLRSGLVFGIVAAVVVGLGAAAYAYAGGSTSTPPAASSNSGTAALPASGAAPKASASGTDKGAGHVVLSRLTVTSVDNDSFTGTDARGQTVTVLFSASTEFGTTARPLTRAQLVPGAVVWVRGRRLASSGVIVAGIVANGVVSGSGSASGGSDA